MTRYSNTFSLTTCSIIPLSPAPPSKQQWYHSPHFHPPLTPRPFFWPFLHLHSSMAGKHAYLGYVPSTSRSNIMTSPSPAICAIMVPPCSDIIIPQLLHVPSHLCHHDLPLPPSPHWHHNTSLPTKPSMPSWPTPPSQPTVTSWPLPPHPPALWSVHPVAYHTPSSNQQLVLSRLPNPSWSSQALHRIKPTMTISKIITYF